MNVVINKVESNKFYFTVNVVNVGRKFDEDFVKVSDKISEDFKKILEEEN